MAKVVVVKMALIDFDAEGFEEALEEIREDDVPEGYQILSMLGIEDARVQLVGSFSCGCEDEDHGPSVDSLPALIVDARIEERREFDDEECETCGDEGCDC